MVKGVLKYMFFAAIIILIIFFFIAGGIGKTIAAARAIGNPLSNIPSVPYFTLPWEVPIPQGPDISSQVGSQGQSSKSVNSSESQTFGNPSPYANSVSISAEGATTANPRAEYVVIQNDGPQTLDITGWSLQSALSGVRAYLPHAAGFFESGAINTESDVTLTPGGTAVVTSGNSPVGTSFRENECSGYLGNLQQFTPPIQVSCPDPANEIALAQSYGAACAQYVSSLNACTFPQDIPSNLPLSCQEFLQDSFSYNGCVQEYGAYTNFESNVWRLYLASPQELWRNDTDTIRLLDAQGQIVAVTSY